MRDASSESWEQYRKRMLDETSRFIEWGLAHPEESVWIPTKPATGGGFPKAVGDWFWTVVLSDSDSGSRIAWLKRLVSRINPPWKTD